MKKEFEVKIGSRKAPVEISGAKVYKSRKVNNRIIVEINYFHEGVIKVGNLEVVVISET